MDGNGNEHENKGSANEDMEATKKVKTTVLQFCGYIIVGPTVSHGSHSFCFVHNFRQRFGAIVANAICQGLGRDTRAAVTECRNANMYLDDLGCCEDTCGDVC